MRAALNPSDVDPKAPSEKEICFELAAKTPFFTLNQAKRYAWADQPGVSHNKVRGTLHQLVESGYLRHRSGVQLAKKSYVSSQPLYPQPGMGRSLPSDVQLDQAVRNLSAHYPLPCQPVEGRRQLTKSTAVFFPTEKYFDEQGDGQEQFTDQDALIPDGSIDPQAEQILQSVEGVVQREGRFQPETHLDAFCNRRTAEVVLPFHVVVRFLNLADLYITLTERRGSKQSEQIRASWTPCLTYSPKLYLPCSYAVYSPDGRRTVAAAFCRNIGGGRLLKVHQRLLRFDAFHIN